MNTLSLATQFYQKKLKIPKNISIDVIVENHDLFCGRCQPNEDATQFQITLCPSDEIPLEQILAHEMVHVKQYVLDDMYNVLVKHGPASYNIYRMFRGKRYNEDYSDDSPWELEAYELEETLYKEFCNG